MQPLAMEIIDYQNGDQFPIKLQAVIDEIYTDIDSGRVKSNQKLITETEHSKRIVKLIRDRFNLNVELDAVLANYLPAAILPFSGDYLASVNGVNGLTTSSLSELFGSTNIFKHIKAMEKTRDDYYKRIHNRNGFADTKHARVGGYLADVKHYLILNFFVLKDIGLTSKEVVATIIHEVGHAWEGLESHFRLMTNNRSIVEVLNDLNQNKPEKAYYTFKRHFGPEELEKASLSKDSTITDFYGPLAGRYISTLESQLINNKYDETNYENLADSFAVRFGLGAPLVSGLKKIFDHNGTTVANSVPCFFFLYFVEVMMFAMSLVLFGLGGLIIFGLVFAFFSGTHKQDMTYDTVHDRYNRIRNGIIRNLKDKNLPKEYTEDLLRQFVFVDEILSKSNNMKGLMTLIADYIKPSAREVVYYVKVQQTIENSLDNVLFVKSAQLRHL